jgi:hypothetical protein
VLSLVAFAPNEQIFAPDVKIDLKVNDGESVPKVRT